MKLPNQSARISDMTKTLRNAIAELEGLPECDQEQIGRELLAHVAKLRALRDDLATDMHSLDDGRGRETDVEDVIRRSRSRHAKS
jgi:hypothetical protein